MHEVKFDGYRVQLHKDEDEVCVYCKNGHLLNKRCAGILRSLKQLARAFYVTDGETVAIDTDGKPDFHALHVKGAQENQIEVWCFDLLEINGLDLRQLPLSERKDKLATLLASADDNLRYSEVLRRPAQAVGRLRAETLGRHRQQARRCTLSFRHVGLDQSQMRELAPGQQGQRRAVREIESAADRGTGAALVVGPP